MDIHSILWITILELRKKPPICDISLLLFFVTAKQSCYLRWVADSCNALFFF